MYNILIELGILMKLAKLIKMYLDETYSRVRVDQQLSVMFPIMNGLKQRDALSSLLFKAIRRVQVNQDGLKLNGIHQLLVYADDVNILGGSANTTKKNTETFLIGCKEIGLQVNANKTKYMVTSRDHNVGRSHDIKYDNSSFERVEQFKYLGKIFRWAIPTVLLYISDKYK